jgi:hypothetical protein
VTLGEILTPIKKLPNDHQPAAGVDGPFGEHQRAVPGAAWVRSNVSISLRRTFLTAVDPSR